MPMYAISLTPASPAVIGNTVRPCTSANTTNTCVHGSSVSLTPVNRRHINSSPNFVADVSTVAHVATSHRSRRVCTALDRAATIWVGRSSGVGLRSRRSTLDHSGSISRPACSVRRSEPRTKASTTTPRPTIMQIVTTVCSVSLNGASDTTSPSAAITGRTSLMPMLKMPPAATASVASAVVWPHEVSIR